MMSLAIAKNQHYTYQDYCDWPDDVRYELIDGEPYLMSPAPCLPHQDIVGEIYRQVGNALRGKPCRPFIAPLDVRLPKNDEADERVDSVVQPDFLVVCDESKLDRRGVRGAPDWIVEVLSPSTASRDQIKKRELYERHGVKEYWLIHPTDRLVWVYTLQNGEYGKPGLYDLQGRTEVNVVPGLAIEWDELVARLPEDQGF